MTRTLQKMVHVGCRELGLDREARVAMQLAVTGKGSMSDMSAADLKLVVNRLKRDGFKPAFNGPKKRAAAPRRDLRLIHVLWKKLGDEGHLKKQGRAGLNAFVRSAFEAKWGAVPADVDMLTDWKQIDAVLQALIAWGKRANIDFNWEKIGK